MKDWKIGTRLSGGFALVLALVAAIAAIGVVRLQGVGDATRDMTRQSLEKERLAAAWLLATSTNSVRTFALLKSNDPEVQEFLQKSIGKNSAVINETQKSLEDMLSTPEELALSKDIKSRRAEYLELRNTILKLKSDGKPDEAAGLGKEKLIPTLDADDASIRAMVNHKKDRIDQSSGATNEP